MPDINQIIPEQYRAQLQEGMNKLSSKLKSVFEKKKEYQAEQGDFYKENQEGYRIFSDRGFNYYEGQDFDENPPKPNNFMPRPPHVSPSKMKNYGKSIPSIEGFISPIPNTKDMMPGKEITPRGNAIRRPSALRDLRREQ